MILESEFENDGFIDDIAEAFIKDQFDSSDLDDEVKEVLGNAIAYGMLHALLTVTNGKPIKDAEGKVTDVKYYTIEELLVQAESRLGIDVEEQEPPKSDTGVLH